MARSLAEIHRLAALRPTPTAWRQLGAMLAERGDDLAVDEVTVALRPLAAWPEALRTVPARSDDGWWKSGLRPTPAPWLAHVARLGVEPRALAELPADAAWRREALHPGLAWRLALDARSSLDHVVAALTFPGLRRVELVPGTRDVSRWGELFARAEASHFDELLVDLDALPRGVPERLAESRMAPQLRVLGMPGRRVQRGQMVTRWPARSALEVLDLAGDMFAAEVAATLGARVCTQLTALSLPNARRLPLLRQLAEARLPRLTVLELAATENARDLVLAVERLPELRVLSLGDVRLATARLADLVHTEAFARLERLVLAGRPVDAFVAALLAGPPRPIELHLHGARLEPAIAARLRAHVGQLSLDGDYPVLFPRLGGHDGA